MNKKLLHTIFSLFVLVFMTGASVLGQGTIKGTVQDVDANGPLIGAKVILAGTARGAITDQNGTFTISAEAGSYTLEISYIGYLTESKEITVTDGQTTNAGTIALTEEGVGLDEVNILASVAIDRKTPVAVSTISGAKVEALVGNQEFPEILRSTPSIYVTKQGGGFGDSRINVRGFDQRNTAVMINGVPVNDMENGWVYWSNWAGLSDVTSTVQVQRGLGASKLAVSSVGGSINIVTNAADFKKGGSASVSIGNDGFQKYAAVLSSGLTKSGWAATAQFTHTRGNGWVDGTMFRAYSYFLSVSKTFNDKHTLSFTGLGAPQWHHQRLGASQFDRISLQTFIDRSQPDGDRMFGGDYDGRRWNHTWGTLDGEEFNWRRNFYHKPKFFLNHYWNAGEKTSIKTSAYVSLGRGGGTGPRGRINNGDPNTFFRGRIFDSFSGFGVGTHDNNGQVRFDDIVRYNQGTSFPAFGEPNEEPGTTTSSGDGFIRRASMNSHNWVGVLSTLTQELSSNLTLVAGLDARYYKGIHYRRLENLLGNTSYVSRSDDNNPANSITEASPAEFGNFSDNSYKDGNNVLNYWNDGLVNWVGLFAQLEYSTDQLTVFGAVSGANQGFKRIDYFNYLENDEQRETEWQNFQGGTIKAGANLNLDEKSNIFINGGFFSQQPIFDNVFVNFRNDINPDVENQEVYAIEAGYGFRSRSFRANLNVYSTLWTNRQVSRSVNVPVNDSVQVEGLANFSGIGQLHQGIELEASWNPIYNLTLSGMVSLNNWRYSDDFSATIVDTDNNQTLGTSTIFADGLKVGDAAQTTMNLNADFEIVDGLSIYANWYYADNLYADFNIEDEDQFLKEGGEVLKLPSYDLVDAGISYRFKMGPTSVILRANINNVFDEEYVAELDTNFVNADLPQNGLYTNRGFWGFGRTWNAGLKVLF